MAEEFGQISFEMPIVNDSFVLGDPAVVQDFRRSQGAASLTDGMVRQLIADLTPYRNPGGEALDAQTPAGDVVGDVRFRWPMAS